MKKVKEPKIQQAEILRNLFFIIDRRNGGLVMGNIEDECVPDGGRWKYHNTLSVCVTGGLTTLAFALHLFDASISKQNTRALDLSIDNVRRLRSKRYLPWLHSPIHS